MHKMSVFLLKLYEAFPGFLFFNWDSLYTSLNRHHKVWRYKKRLRERQETELIRKNQKVTFAFNSNSMDQSKVLCMQKNSRS